MTEEGNTLDVQEIHQFLKEIGVASYKLPDQVENIEEWPLTSVGKIDKKVLGQMAQEK
jgi:yersiniabactin salicyl-AMP ligase